ncbi:MAG: efflux RND transporter permease subunit [Candidatus Thermoplasmatota archaeon]|jgi:predicted RND superfamily exporter protein|nr:efflux RND transporter permease subunit [Candidatus Thermoplasmatota archaeon]
MRLLNETKNLLNKYSKIIEKHPVLIVTIIIFITMGFATIIPSMQLKTDFRDFAPDNETVNAVLRVADYFSQDYQVLFLYVEKEKGESILIPDALKEQYYVQKEIKNFSNIINIIGLSTIVNQMTILEFGQPIENCTDEQITIAINDILETQGKTNITVFSENDPNEKIDYKKYPRISKGKSIDAIDIKNCNIDFNDETVKFSIEVYDLTSFVSKLKSPIPGVNVVEWFVDFENLIKPDERLNVSYRISAHLEPKNILWEIGKGPFKNIKAFFKQLIKKELFNVYKKEAYLWIRPPGQTTYLPLLLKSAEVNFNIEKNQVEIKVSREELSKYGISPRFLGLELPAKLTNFKAGTRYYQSPVLKLPWFRISMNTSFLFKKMEKIINRPIMGNILSNIFKKLANITWEDFDKLFEMTDEFVSMPDQISLKDMEELWVNLDTAPDNGVSKNLLYYRPFLFDDLQVAAKALLPSSYETDKKPNCCLIIVSVNLSTESSENQKFNLLIKEEIEELNKKTAYITVQPTGEGIISTEINKTTSNANEVIVPMIFIIIVIILIISFRNLSYMFLTLITLAISLIWLFGTMVLLGMDFNILAVAIIPLILGLGVDYSTHVLHNYKTELGRGKIPSEALRLSITEIGSAMFLSMITTVIAFLSFLSSSIVPLRDFGIILALGIIYIFIATITFVTSTRFLLDRKKKKFKSENIKQFSLNVYMNKSAKFVLKHQKKIILATILFTIIFIIGGSQIKTGFDYYSFLPKENPSIKLYEKIYTDFPFASQDLEYILIEGNIATVDCLKGIARTHENFKDNFYIAKNADGTLKTTSLYTIITKAVNQNKSLIKEFNLDEKTFIPKTNKDLQQFYDYLYNDLVYGIQTRTVIHKSTNGNYDATTIQIYVNIVVEGRRTEELDKYLKKINQELNEDLSYYGKDTKAILTGMMTITYNITTNLTKSQILSTGLCIILSLIILIIVYKRFSLGLVVMIPVLIAIIWIIGTMYFLGYSLNILTITVTSLTIGCGIDYAIHATERFRLIADKTGDINSAVVETISRTGGALFIAALTTAVGFSVLIFAPIPPQVQFGVITAVTITYAFLLSVLVLPLVLAHWASWSRKRRGYIISPTPADEKYLKELLDYNNKILKK